MNEELKQRAAKLGLHGLIDHWDELQNEAWIEKLLLWEENSRAQRGLERRRRLAKLGVFKHIADFDWSWPKKIDRRHVEDLFRLQWIEEKTNVVLIGPNGVGKTMIAKNLAHQAVLDGATVRAITASELLNSLSEQETSASLRRKLNHFAQPKLLLIDELGYLSYDNRYADLLFEVVSRRYENKSIMITTNKPFSQWGEVFPNATSVVTLIDRLVHRCEVIHIEGESFRLKESKESARKKARKRQIRKSTKT